MPEIGTATGAADAPGLVPPDPVFALITCTP